MKTIDQNVNGFRLRTYVHKKCTKAEARIMALVPEYAATTATLDGIIAKLTPEINALEGRSTWNRFSLSKHVASKKTSGEVINQALTVRYFNRFISAVYEDNPLFGTKVTPLA